MRDVAAKQFHHDSVVCEAIIMTINPNYVRIRERRAAGLFSLHGVSLEPQEKTLALGYRAIDYLAELTAREVQAAITRR